jgi:FkbM family methyltransferase
MFDEIRVRFLQHFGSENLRTAIGRESLSEIEKFVFDGYTDILYRNLNIQPSDAVLVLGGYLGDSVQRWLDISVSRIFVVEPVNEYFEKLKLRFGDHPRVELFQFAIGDKNGITQIYVDGLKSGANAASDSVQSSKLIAADEFLTHLGVKPTIIEINIEGGEYPVMQNLLDSKMISDIKTLIIQFHRFTYQNESHRGEIRAKLSATHKEMYCYDWVWERWDKKSEER